MEMSSGRGIGLAEMLVQQLGGEARPVQQTRESFSLSAPSRVTARNDKPAWSSPGAFARDVWPHVERVAQKLNIAAEALLAQAALETGWGEHVMQRSNGVSSYNLFGIKAGQNWSGSSVARPTLEFVEGVAQRRVERFRAYPDLAAAFDDYASLIGDNPRYDTVRNQGADTGGFAGALQDAGYATDPFYARKIAGILRGATMRAAINDLKPGATAPTITARTSAAFR